MQRKTFGSNFPFGARKKSSRAHTIFFFQGHTKLFSAVNSKDTLKQGPEEAFLPSLIPKIQYTKTTAFFVY